MKTITFPPGVHLVALEGNTTSEDFLAAFQYENRHIEYITPSFFTAGRVNLTKDCCPIVLLPHRREEAERLIDRLNQLSTQHSATIFVFISNPVEYFYEAQKSFTSILTFDKDTNGGIVKKGAGDMYEGPYTIDHPPCDIGDTLRKDPADEPSTKPTETVTKISDLVKTRGFHRVNVSEIIADALLRGDKTDIICSASNKVQKGDWLVPNIDNKLSHAINDSVWEVTFVTYIRQSERDDGYGWVALSIRRIPNARFEKGDIAGPYFVDSIVTTNP